MADRNLWAQIEEDYKQAHACFFCPKGGSNWRSDEDTGMYHLYCAYQSARTSEEKDHLLYARILSLMEWKHRYLSEYDRLHKFIAPAFEEYKLAVQNDGQRPSEKELQSIQRKFSELTYICERMVDYGEELERAYHMIEASDLLANFGFHDSKPMFFQHTDQVAILKLNYNGLVATFEFTGLYEIEVNGDPLTNWINEMYCYHSYWNKDYIVFDIRYYRIECEHVKVLSVEKQGGED